MSIPAGHKRAQSSKVKAAAAVMAMAMLAAACSSDGTEEISADTPLVDAEAPEATTVQTSEPAEAEEAMPEPVATFADLDAYMTETVQADPALDGAGLIIVDANGVLHHQSFGTFSLDRTSPIASSAKMISAGVLLRLHEEGLLDIDAPLTEITDLAADHPDMTVAQLLSNSSGLPNDGLYEAYLCQYGGVSLTECTAAILTTPDDDADVIAPDTQFLYGGAQWQVAGGIAELASGETWDELIQRIYIEPCGLESLGYGDGIMFSDFPNPPAWFDGDAPDVPETTSPNIEGGGYINTTDFGVLLQMQLNGGQCSGGQVLSQASLDLMHADRIGAAYNGITWQLNGGYGLGWWHYGPGEIGVPGAFGSLAWLNEDAGYAAFWVIEDTFQTRIKYEGDLRNLVHEAVTGEVLAEG